MALSLNMVTYLVRDYDEAIDYFVKTLGFDLIEDTVLTAQKRWVRVGAGGMQLLLARAVDDQVHAIGNQAGGRVGFFLASDDFDVDYNRMTANGVNFAEAPRAESYGRVAVFADLYGNRWDLIGR